jgi:hypothetical protein
MATTRDSRNFTHKSKCIEVVQISWTSDGSGDFTEALELNGWLVKVVTDPDGTDAPTANYDITLVDENSVDAANSLLINRHTSTTEEVYTLVSGAATPILLSGDHTFTVANAGDTKAGVCKLYLVSEL